MTRRSTPLSKAFSRAFPHRVTLKEQTDLRAWQDWCRKRFGPSDTVVERIRRARWGCLGGQIGFKRPDDLAAFIFAARDDLRTEELDAMF